MDNTFSYIFDIVCYRYDASLSLLINLFTRVLTLIRNRLPYRYMFVLQNIYIYSIGITGITGTNTLNLFTSPVLCYPRVKQYQS